MVENQEPFSLLTTMWWSWYMHTLLGRLTYGAIGGEYWIRSIALLVHTLQSTP